MKVLSLSVLIVLGGVFSLSGQVIQWADHVVEVSSSFQYAKAPGAYDAKNALGKPSVTPGTFKDGNYSAWTPATASNPNPEFIEVEFSKACRPIRVLINENMTAGGITRIVLKGEGKEQLVYSNDNPKVADPDSRLFEVKFPAPAFKVNRVRIEINSSISTKYFQIDAVGLSEDHVKYVVEPKIDKNIDRTLIQVQNLGANVNSYADDLLPVVTADGKRVYFVRQGHEGNIQKDYQDVWFTDLQPDNSFGPAQHMPAPINQKFHNSVCSISPDGQRLMLLNVYNADGTSDAGHSVSTKTATGWSFPEKLVTDGYYNDNIYSETCMGPTGTVRIFTLQRKDSKGDKDLYVSFLKEDGTWSEPKHMGDAINSSSTETSPFLAADNQTLYFGSKGFPGYGQTDIFYSKRLDDTWTNWSEPVNLGKPYNDETFNAYFTVPASGEFVYFVSYGSSLGGADIFRAKLVDKLKPNPVVLINGKVVNKKTAEPIATSIPYFNLRTGEQVGTANSDPADGSFSLVLPSGELYGFNASKDGFLPVSKNIDLKNLKNYDVKTINLELVPIELGAKIVLNNIYFDVAKSNLRKESNAELQQLAKILKSNAGLKIRIGGHTDTDGSDDYNMKLSTDRAQAVFVYLRELGVDSSRFEVRGYGETSPIVPNTTPENKQLNRRVEFEIIGM